MGSAAGALPAATRAGGTHGTGTERSALPHRRPNSLFRALSHQEINKKPKETPQNPIDFLALEIALRKV